MLSEWKYSAISWSLLFSVRIHKKYKSDQNMTPFQAHLQDNICAHSNHIALAATHHTAPVVEEISMSLHLSQSISCVDVCHSGNMTHEAGAA